MTPHHSTMAVVRLWRSLALSLLSLFFISVLPIRAGIVNRTIDDGLGDSDSGKLPIYLPANGTWDDQTCLGCAIQPDTSKAFDRTYTAATYNPDLGSVSIELDFQGLSLSCCPKKILIAA